VHPFGDLSAYLDGALSPEARASVQAHLDACALCRTRLAELRGTARLIASLPSPAPSRSLIPRVAAPVWMVVLRRFSTVASAAAILLFVVSAAMRSLPLATSSGVPAAAPAPNAALDSAGSGATAASSAPAPAASPGAAFGVVPTTTPSTIERTQTASDSAKRLDTGSAAPTSDLAVSFRETGAPARAPFDPFPWLWLVLGVAFGALSFILGRRLRSA
jgi:anti-sigma factor RsiW